jgi:hypothetical protein
MHDGISLVMHGFRAAKELGRAAARGSTLVRRRREVASIEQTLEPALESFGLGPAQAAAQGVFNFPIQVSNNNTLFCFSLLVYGHGRVNGR